MKKIVVCLMLLGLSLGTPAEQVASYEVVPMPQSITAQKGSPFVLNSQVAILAPDELRREAAFLQQYLAETTGLELQLAQRREKHVEYITLALSPKVSEREGYVMVVSPKGISITGASASGVFHGIQTLRKSASTGLVFEPVIIRDAPRFGYRGMHLDCCRHFFSVDFVKKYIDLLALHNMNTFHWHLTDDQGWRIEIKSWPKLTTVGASRSGTVIGHNSDLDDETPVSGFYTQDEAREIVSYAAERHITVIPEIELPGHTLAALASYPELGCTGGPYQVGHYWGIYRDVLCVGNETVYRFVADVLKEIAGIFPSEIIHIGGDETPTDRWEACAKCQALGLPKEKIQGYFTRRVCDILAGYQRRALGWDEILDDAPQSALIMSWRGTEPGAKAAEAGHDVIMAPTGYCYFDYQQTEDAYSEPSLCGGNITVEKVYSLEPAADSLSAVAKAHILGVQANLWSEYLTTETLVEYQALPRMSALSEVQWTQPERKDYQAFKSRLTRMLPLFERYHYHYAKHLWPERRLSNRWQF